MLPTFRTVTWPAHCGGCGTTTKQLLALVAHNGVALAIIYCCDCWHEVSIRMFEVLYGEGESD